MIEQYKEQAENPNWKEFDKQRKHIHDWRTYITEEVRVIWEDVSLIGRCAIISCCENVAGNEEWD